VIVQRTLAAKNIAHARGATIVAGYFKLLPLFLIIFPGMVSRVLYPGRPAWGVTRVDKGSSVLLMFEDGKRTHATIKTPILTSCLYVIIIF